MTQTTQNKVGILSINYDGSFNSLYQTGNKPQYAHGFDFSFTDPLIGTNSTSVTSFLQQQIEAVTTGANIADANGWTFNNSSFAPAKGYVDSVRGNVLYSDYAGGKLDAVKSFDSGSGIAPNTKYYWSWYTRCSIKTTGGVDYDNSHQIQWKHGRIIDINSISDTAGNAGCEMVLFNWKGGAGAQHRIENELLDVVRYSSNGSVYPDINAGWAKLEFFLNTGSVGSSDGTLKVVIHKNGTVNTGIALVNSEKFYTATKRHRYFNIQDYFGNNVDPIISKETWIDDPVVIVGSWKRILLTNGLDLTTASIQEPQKFTTWSGNTVSGKINVGGIQTSGNYYLVAADDQTVIWSKQIYVTVG